MSLHAVLFYLLATITAISAIAVVVSQNIVRAATWLLFALAGTAGIYFLLGAEFVAATQLLIYVGGTLVLVIFGVMLTAQGPFIKMKIGIAEWAIGLFVGLMFFGVLAVSLRKVEAPVATTSYQEGKSLAGSKYLGASLLGDPKVMPSANMTGIDNSKEENKRERKRVGFLLPFEIVSVHLLVVLIGAAYLARAKRRIQATKGAVGAGSKAGSANG